MSGIAPFWNTKSPSIFLRSPVPLPARSSDTLQIQARTASISTRKKSWLDAYTLLFGREDGSHQIKRFYPETQTYGLIEDTSPVTEPEDIAEKYAAETEQGADPSPQALEQIYQSQLELKRLAGAEFPIIAGGVPTRLRRHQLYSGAFQRNCAWDSRSKCLRHD